MFGKKSQMVSSQSSKCARYFKEHKKTIYASLVGFSLLAVLAVGPAIVQAVLTISAQQALLIQQKNDAIETAILNNDYNTWQSLVTDQNLKATINSSNFSQFAQAYRLLQQGKVDEANIIKKSLSLKQDFAAAATKSRAIDDAIMNNDYNAWRAIVGTKVETSVNSTNFTNYANAYNLILSGKLKQAGYIKDRIGLKVEPRNSSSR